MMTGCFYPTADASEMTLSNPEVPPSVADAAVEKAIFRLLAARQHGTTICPSEVARDLAPVGERWRALMPQVRRVAQGLVVNGELLVTRRGVAVDATSPGGPIRLGRPVQRDPA